MLLIRMARSAERVDVIDGDDDRVVAVVADVFVDSGETGDGSAVRGSASGPGCA